MARFFKRRDEAARERAGSLALSDVIPVGVTDSVF